MTTPKPSDPLPSREPLVSDIDPPGVATGDRRGTVHYEADADQLVRVRATAKPDAPMPPDIPASGPHEAQRFSAAPPVEDVAVVTPEPSVWDARPPDER
jgi:hypothetical protein